MQPADLARIADIIPPEAPATSTSPVGFIFILPVIIFVIAGIYFYWSTPHAQLFRLQRRHKARSASNRDIAFCIRALIYEVLNLREAKSKLSQRTDWQQFNHHLLEACFKQAPPDDEQIVYLFKQSRRWLKLQ